MHTHVQVLHGQQAAAAEVLTAIKHYVVEGCILHVRRLAVVQLEEEACHWEVAACSQRATSNLEVSGPALWEHHGVREKDDDASQVERRPAQIQLVLCAGKYAAGPRCVPQ